MTRAGESGSYLGGISTMLMQTDVCPSCGGTHTSRRLPFSHRSDNDCPAVVFGSLPIVTDDGSSEVADYASEASELGVGVYPGGLPVPRPMGRRASAMSVPWPMPGQPEDSL
jgi:hypothetical protein